MAPSVITEEKNKIVQIAVYTRKSNDENLAGEVTSLDSQKGACRAYIAIQKEKGWREYTEAFDDPNESGKSLNRPAMRRLLNAVEEDKIQGVIVYKLDRLTRNSRDFHQLLELFEKHNVAFVSATESIDTKSPQGRLMTAIMVQFAQYDREMDVERSKDFHLARARKGLWSAGLPPLGYDFKDKQLVVNQEEAALVRRIFDLYLERRSVLRVAEELNRLGFRRKSYKLKDGRLVGGKPFDINSVIRILQRKVYIGIITNERTKQEFSGQHQPIIDPAVFEKAQEILKSHARREGQITYATNRHGFRLKGLTRCGECGSSVASVARPRGDKKVYLYYKCLAKQNGLPVGCVFTSIGAQKLEEYVIEKLAAVGWDRPLLERVVRKVNELSRGRVAPLEEEKRQLSGRLQGLRGEIGNLIGLAKAQGANQELTQELGRLDEAKRTLEARLHEIEAEIGRGRQVVYDADVIQGALQRFARFIYKLPIERQVQTIQLLVQQVTLFKDRVRVELHELPIPDLQRALDARIAQRGILERKFPIPRCSNGGSKIPHAERTGVVELDKEWRGRRDLNPRSPP